MKYRKKPVVIEAIQLTEENISEIYEWMGISGQGNFPGCGHGIDPEDGQFKITTLEGVHIAKINDYIIRGIKGEYYPCKPDIFAATYEEVKELISYMKDIEKALLESELIDLKKENEKMYAMLKRIGDCDWCVYAELGEFEEPCLNCRSGSKFMPDYSLLEKVEE